MSGAPLVGHAGKITLADEAAQAQTAEMHATIPIVQRRAPVRFFPAKSQRGDTDV